MADNIIKRVIKLILDKESAKQTQEDANAVASNIDSAWKSMATKVAGYLGAAFLISKVVGFGKAAVAEAMESESAWKMLKGTVDATGASFDAIEGKIRAAADAFQDSTIHDDDAFAQTMSRMVTLTGDVNASLNNMGLVANVAAQFFNGELEPAAMLVSKAMNGNVIALQKMGIHAKDADQALAILAQRSMGAATREAGTFSGQLKQMDEQWKDVLKDLGGAIIASDGTTSAITVLRSAIKVLGDWVIANKDNIKQWVKDGLLNAIDAADIFIRAVWGMTNVVGGGFTMSLGLATQAVAKLMLGLVKAREVIDVVQEFLGIGDPKKAKATTQALEDQARALDEWGKSLQDLGAEKVHKGIDVLSNPLFSSKDFAKARPVVPELQVNKPMMGANASTDASKAVEAALKQFTEDAKAAANMQRILGQTFDVSGAEIERTTKLLNVLAANGIDPASVGMGGLSDRLKDLVTNIKPGEDATKALTKTLGTDMAMGAITAATAVDQLKQQQNDLMTVMKGLLDAGVSPTSQAITDLTDRYWLLHNAISDAEKIQAVAEAYKNLGDEIRSNMFMATLDGSTSLDQMKAKQQALLKAMQELMKKGISPQSKELKDLAAQYRDVTDAIEEQTLVMQLQSAAADFLADALGTAMQGGLHEAASQKAKQNAVEAAEMLVRAGAFALFGDFAHAGAALALAGQFAGIAAAWGIIAASSGGSSGGASVAAPTSGGGGASSAGSDLSSSRSSSNDSASRAEQPSAEVSVYLVGPGFDALNPEVQRVVWGAQQQAEERYGPNARVRVGPNR